MVLERNNDYWNKGHPFLDEAVIRPLPDARALRQPVVRRGRHRLGRQCRRHRQGAGRCRSCASTSMSAPGCRPSCCNTKTPALERCAGAAGACHAIDMKEMSEASPGRSQAGAQSLRRGFVGQVQGHRRAALRSGQGGGVAQGLRRAGRSSRYIVTANPRGRAVGQVFQQFWKAVGADMEIDQVDQATIVAACLHAPVPDGAVAHHRSGRSRSADVREFPHRQPVNTRWLLQSGPRRAAGARAGDRRSRQAQRGLLRDQQSC